MCVIGTCACIQGCVCFSWQKGCIQCVCVCTCTRCTSVRPVLNRLHFRGDSQAGLCTEHAVFTHDRRRDCGMVERGKGDVLKQECAKAGSSSAVDWRHPKQGRQKLLVSPIYLKRPQAAWLMSMKSVEAF